MTEDVPNPDVVFESSPPSDSGIAAESHQVVVLRSRARSALLSRSKGSAREILGKLVTLSGDLGDRKNLDDLIKGVDEELRSFIASRGSIERRLLDRTPLETIQEELNRHIPHWRGFANDLPALNLARVGLPAHADPALKERLKSLEARLAAGEVLPVLEEWENIGTPAGACSAGFVQIADILGCLSDKMEERNWRSAQAAHDEATSLLKEDDCAAFRESLEAHLRHIGEVIRWERLLGECQASLPALGKRDKQRLAEALYAANDGIERRVAKEPGLKDLQTRLRDMREAIETAGPPPTQSGSGVKWAIVILLVIVAILAAIWFYFGLTPT